MTEPQHPSQGWFYLRVLGAILLMTGSWFAGIWFVKLVGPKVKETVNPKDAAAGKTKTGERAFRRDPDAPPFFFFPGKGLNENSRPVSDEVEMAAKNAVHQYVIPVAGIVPWKDGESFKSVMDTVSRVLRFDRDAVFLFQVDLNPGTDWMDTHTDGCIQKNSKGERLPSVVCPSWHEECKRALEKLVKDVAASPIAEHAAGYILTALGEGNWLQPEENDRSSVNRDGFRQWLKGRYATDDGLRKAWAAAEAALASAEIPARPKTDDLQNVFFTLPKQQPSVDFLQYTAESVADTIASFVTIIRGKLAEPLDIYATYGFSFEQDKNDTGHAALGLLLGSDISGFVSPVSYLDRGVGGVGAPMGPITSALKHGKKWLLMDDTRTGVSWNVQSNTAERIRGLRAEDVFNVQRRNFSTAIIYGAGLIWADPFGEGWLHDDAQWQVFSEMQRIYAYLKTAPQEPPADASAAPKPMTSSGSAEPTGRGGRPEGEPGDKFDGDVPAEGLAHEGGADEAASDGETSSSIEGEPTAEGEGQSFVPMFTESGAPMVLTVVTDERSRYVQQCDAPLNTLLLRKALEAAMRAGIATRLCLLQDLLDGDADPSSAYLMLNTFVLSQDERQRLHERFKNESACVIWLYAPGYFSDGIPDVANLSQTIQMQAAQFDGGGKAGSLFALPGGEWLKQDEEFGDPQTWKPLFYINDPAADTLGKYRDSKKVSLALRVLDGGWTSVFLADPGLSPALLCEVLSVLDQHLYFRPAERNFFDMAVVGESPTGQGRLLAVHARQSGDRMIALNGFCMVQDLFDPNNVSRPQESFLKPWRNGETHLYRLYPVAQ